MRGTGWKSLGSGAGTCLIPAVVTVAGMAFPAGGEGAYPSASTWQVGTPIVTYYAGPDLNEAAARQMAEGHWNLVWCNEKQLDTVHQYGLRGQLTDGLLAPQSLDDPAQREQLDALIERVREHPALYSYYIIDEPNAAAFPALGRLVAYLRERDPAHFAYINLFPTYANNEQLGTQGDTVTAYREHLRQYVEIVQPDLISYDHYHFTAKGDGGQYFLNLGMIRQAALEAELPFLNIVQGSTWDPAMRAPNGDELRWLAYTSLAYGAQGLSYFVYSHPPFYKPGGGQMADPEGHPTELYFPAKSINREFAAVAAELQPLRSLGAYHLGMIPEGGEELPAEAPFRLEPPVPTQEYQSPQPLQGMLLGFFGAPGHPTHVVVVNLDYQQEVSTTVVGPGPLHVFHPGTGAWPPTGGHRAELRLPPGGGKLLRIRE